MSTPTPEPVLAPAAENSRARTWILFGIPTLALIVIVSVVIVVVHASSSLSAAVSKVRCDPQHLSSCLIAAPAQAAKVQTRWGSSTAVTPNAYSNQYIDKADGAQGQDWIAVSNDGVGAIVHRNWSVGGDSIDLILLQFATPQGAQAWALDRSGTFMARDRGASFAVTGDPNAQAYPTATFDSAGDFQIEYATVVGAMVLEAHYSSHRNIDRPNFEDWVGTEYASLLTAPAAVPSPAPTATASQGVTCAGEVTACLMPRPSGYTAWNSPTHSPTYTIDGYASELTYTETDGQQKEEQQMASDGITGIYDEDWYQQSTNASGWLVLLQSRTDEGATSQFSWDNSQRPHTFSIPGYPDAIGYGSDTADSSGIYWGVVAAQVGDLYMQLWLDFSGSFDDSLATSWAVQELNLLTQNVSVQGIPIPQVTTPSLTAPSPASCSGGPGGCLMALPQGATSTTASSYQTTTDEPIYEYLSEYENSRIDYMNSWLTDTGNNGGSHQAWTADDGATADDVLLTFGTAQEAEAAGLKIAGDKLPGTQSCSVPGLQHAYCMVQPQSTADIQAGTVSVSVLAWKGTYLMDLEISQSGSADTSDALAWAQQQLAELPVG